MDKAYALFLRGINVSGIKVPMADLRACLEHLGYDAVTTYLQTGNATFCSAHADPKIIEEALTQRFGYDAHVLLFPRTALADIVASYPFPHVDDYHRYAVLCDGETTAAALVAQATSADVVAAHHQVVYWSCPKGSTLSTPFSAELAKKRWKTVTTNRNLNTLEKMLLP